MRALLVLSFVAFLVLHVALLARIWSRCSSLEKVFVALAPGAPALIAFRLGERKVLFAWVGAVAVFGVLVVIAQSM
jgi:hypothetical protein